MRRPAGRFSKLESWPQPMCHIASRISVARLGASRCVVVCAFAVRGSCVEQFLLTVSDRVGSWQLSSPARPLN